MRTEGKFEEELTEVYASTIQSIFGNDESHVMRRYQVGSDVACEAYLKAQTGGEEKGRRKEWSMSAKSFFEGAK